LIVVDVARIELNARGVQGVRKRLKYRETWKALRIERREAVI